MKLRPLNWPGVRVQLPSALWVPADRVAPSGTPVMVTWSSVSPVTSDRWASMVSGMALSSLPVAAVGMTMGASATPVTVTDRVAGADTAVEPFSRSTEVAVTLRVMVPEKSCCGVRRRFGRSAASTFQVLLPSLWVLRTLPKFRLAPSGTPEMVT